VDLSGTHTYIHPTQKWIEGQLYKTTAPSIIYIVDSADSTLFHNILSNNGHVLHSFLPAVKASSYNLRARAHNKVLPANSTAQARNFIYEMLYENIYRN